jgi:hypothetical protein
VRRDRHPVRVVLLVPLLMVALGCGNHRQVVDVSRIQVSPSPEGPTLIASHETSSGLLAQTVPRTWPANPAQECQLGTTIEITVGRRTYRYGPCSWPSSIERLRRTLISASKQHRTNRPTQTASAAAWKAVLNDWYDGRMNHWHPCQAVLEAIRHLPVDGPIYSTIGLDLKAYARGVC